MELAGVFAAVPTPFDDHERLCVDRLPTAFGRWLATPLAGFLALGSNGEAAHLDEDESERLIASTRDLVPSDRLFIVGTGRESTRATVRASQRAAALGADVVLVRTPGFFRSQMTTEALVVHYQAVADSSPVPVLLYNFTAVTGVNLLPEAAARLSAHSNIIGMKESSGDIAKISELVSASPGGFSVLVGSSSTFYPSLCVGARGGILALACVLPAVCTRLYALTRQQRYAEALALQQQIGTISRLVGSLHGVPGLKAALAVLGLDFGSSRRPLRAVRPEALLAIQDALARMEEPVV